MNKTTVSPNTAIMPVSAMTENDHLIIGGVDVVDLAIQFGTPLWIVDEDSIRAAAGALQEGLSIYPNARALYAGKAFLCLAMCHLVNQLDMGIDVVSEGELFTALEAGFPPDRIFLHGNNKSESEIRKAIEAGPVRIVIDHTGEIKTCADIARMLGRKVPVLLRMTPGVEPDTHHYIKTGQNTSKFGLPLDELNEATRLTLANQDALTLLGLHVHIGSQSKELEPYLEIVEILADLYKQVKDEFAVDLPVLDVGGGLGITYVESDKPVPIFEWARQIGTAVQLAFERRKLPLPELLVEPGRSIVGTAGVTIYRVGYTKKLPGGLKYIAVDGGMADNPRPITYQAKYTARVANRMESGISNEPVSIVGRFCESGDIIVEEACLSADRGDLIAVFATGAYNYSMSSNYNRTGRPACVLVRDGHAEVIIERESNADLIARDRVPERLRERRKT